MLSLRFLLEVPMSSVSRVSWGSIVAAGLIAIALAFMAVSLKTGLLQFRGG